MTKQEFLNSLKEKLSTLPENDVEERLNFYSELIDDIMEEGSAEENAIASIGYVDDIASQIISEFSSKNENENDFQELKQKQKRKLKTWEILLLAVGSPIWVPLGIAAFAIVISLYAVLWALIASFWAVFAALSACAPAGIIAGICLIATAQGALGGISLIAAGLVCAGLAIFTFFGCLASTKGSALITKNTVLGMKNHFTKKEAV